MNITQFLLEMRTTLDDPGSKHWSDLTIVTHGNRQLQALMKRAIEQDENYYNYQFDILKTSARQMATDVWEYDIPPGVVKFSMVREKQDDNTSHFKRVMHPITKHRRGPGYDFSGLTTFRLYGHPEALDLTLWVAKRPARVTRGTLPTQAAITTTELRLDEDSGATYEHETITNSYANALVEITGTNAVGHAVGGQIRRVTASAHLQNQGGTLYTVLTVSPAWTVVPVGGDGYEMHFELPEEHTRLLVLLSARACWQLKGHADEIRAHRDELQESWLSFINDIRSRQIQEPRRMLKALSSIPGRMHDPDKFDYPFVGQ